MSDVLRTRCHCMYCGRTDKDPVIFATEVICIECMRESKGGRMENQHRKITGYRDLTQEEIDLMNEIKAKGGELGVLVAKLRSLPSIDQRWISIGVTDLQTGIMALIRGVTKPESF